MGRRARPDRRRAGEALLTADELLVRGAALARSRWRRLGAPTSRARLLTPVLDVAHVGGASRCDALLATDGDALRADAMLHHLLVWGQTWRRRWAAAAAEAALARYDVAVLPEPWRADRRYLDSVIALLPPPSRAPAAPTDEVPLGRRGAFVTCAVRIGDREVVAAVDTGAATSVLTPALCRVTGASAALGAQRTVWDGAGRPLTTWPAVVPVLEVGGAEVGPIVATVLELPLELGVEMILSPSDLGAVVTLDLGRPSMRVGEVGVDGHQITTELWWADGLPAAPVRVEGRLALFGIDTGAVRSVVHDALVVERTGSEARTMTAAGELPARLVEDVRIDVGTATTTGQALVRAVGGDPLAVGLELDGLLGADRLVATTIDRERGILGVTLSPTDR